MKFDVTIILALGTALFGLVATTHAEEPLPLLLTPEQAEDIVKQRRADKEALEHLSCLVSPALLLAQL